MKKRREGNKEGKRKRIKKGRQERKEVVLEARSGQWEKIIEGNKVRRKEKIKMER